MNTVRACWCGNVDLQPFGHDYGECRDCGSLVVRSDLLPDHFQVKNDETDFYGKTYWTSHQQNDCGIPDIYARSRNDLTDRNLHWLSALLKYRSPPAVVIELGCSHGAFVALMRQAGFEASGIELSPWVADLGQKRFDAPIHAGPIDSLALAAGSLDAIVLMDVLEHLPAPEATMRHCLSLLKPDGFLMVQTPRFKEGMTYDALFEAKDVFLSHLIPNEHIHLFSERSARQLFQRLSAEHVRFEPAIFAHYDMFFLVSRMTLEPLAPQVVESALLSSRGGRMSLALLDLRNRETELLRRLRESEDDRSQRLLHIQTLTKMLEDSTGDRAAIAESTPESNRERASLVPGASPILAIDLTPLTPGPENGGAKVMTVELVGHLSRLLADWELVLLTSPTNHEYLGFLDSPTVRRHRAPPRFQSTNSAPRVSCAWTPYPLFKHLDPFVPGRVKNWVKKMLHALRHRAAAPPAGKGLLSQLGANVLLCPFTAPYYIDPEIPAISIVYDLQFRSYPQFFTEVQRLEREEILRSATDLADRVVCISDHVKRTLIEGTSVDADRVETIPIGRTDRLGRQSSELISRVMEQHRLTPGRFLYYPANAWPHKNHRLLLTVLGMYNARHPRSDLKLVCTGAPGNAMNSLRSAIASMKLQDRVLLPGFICDAECAVLFQSALALIFPSLYEGFGMPVLEAMALGTPVLCGNLTALPEVAGTAAITFDPMDPESILEAIRKIETDPELRADLVVRGYRRAGEVGSAREMSARYASIIQELSREERRPRGLSVTGFYSDGWTADFVLITSVDSEEVRSLELVLELPVYAPHPEVTATIRERGNHLVSSRTIGRGERQTLRHPLSSRGAFIHVTVDPSFHPVQHGIGTDVRRLGCRYISCQIVSPKANIDLMSVGLQPS
jgi:glycosyltransferase involved in cell wall biosynthesis/2-polyprenyl-3-methyl-5-hydroxy-6-metoxy-1,4-benzoquinol methylase